MIMLKNTFKNDVNLITSYKNILKLLTWKSFNYHTNIFLISDLLGKERFEWFAQFKIFWELLVYKGKDPLSLFFVGLIRIR